MFDHNGYLPPGVHRHTTASLKKAFVDGTSRHPQRAKVFASYQQFVAFLQRSNVRPEQWIGGSFVTNKEAPRDIDLVSICKPEELLQVPAELQDEFANWFEGSKTAERNCCDSYIVVVGHEEHPKSDKFKTIYEYWQHQFGHDDQGTPKGFVSTNVTDPPKPEERKQ